MKKTTVSVAYALNKNKNTIALCKRGLNVYKTEGIKGIKNRLNIFYQNDSYEKTLIANPTVDISLFNYLEHYNRTFDLAKNICPKYTCYKENEIRNFDTKLIAFYLPQFHCFPENDKWWGKGFTEWRNVTKAVPQFIGHNQPLLPSDLGFYDLNNDDVLMDQVKIAKNYGIAAFCFHYYWFSGRKLMNKPIEKYLNNKELDLNFCICWANENWTRRWDGNESDVLIGQEHSLEIDSKFILDIKQFLEDERYIKVNGKKLIVIYRPSIIPNIKEVVENWRTHCRNNGLGEIHLVMAKSFDQVDPSLYGFDAAVEFPPHQLGAIVSPEKIDNTQLLNKSFEGLIFDYNKVVNAKLREYKDQFSDNLYRTVFPSWDNEARKPGRGHIFKGSTSGKYQEWLEGAIDYSKKNKVENESLVFINAWNEWAEGAVLEPTLKEGYSYLNATFNALERSKVNDFCIQTQRAF
ncbi:glycoside hydrolase family 99-like domain-containing protein [Photobacterium damselae]|uniref:glycosyltransferase WbsX family protein n=1 Tax=Photobacterium damselae TaxID=38293 RepID=UPI001F21EFB1|nr:glycoside hydrolase family 99-like domain-containing protein [Photobacterium damselae]UKA29892.1 glycoside hydrolase family 99-like domain-containing protein [Photobacterium damselae subsp. damselae]